MFAELRILWKGLFNSECKAQPVAAVADRWGVEATARRAAEPRIVAPAAPTVYAVRPTGRACRIDLSVVAIGTVPV